MERAQAPESASPGSNLITASSFMWALPLPSLGLSFFISKIKMITAHSTQASGMTEEDDPFSHVGTLLSAQ